MIVGLGTGRAASRAIEALARRVKLENLSIRCVATSVASRAQGESHGLRVVELEPGVRIDYLFDGADEVDPALRMIKGRGGAMTREKIVAHSSGRCVYLVQRSKLVKRLGEQCPLPIELAAGSVRAAIGGLEALGLRGTLRNDDRGDEYRTDLGNPVLDAPLTPGVDVMELSAALDALPGVIGHGLFLREADEVLVEEGERGAVERMQR